MDNKWLLAHLSLGRQVFALQEYENGKKLYARFSLDEKHRVFRVLLHALREDPDIPKSNAIIIKVFVSVILFMWDKIKG